MSEDSVDLEPVPQVPVEDKKSNLWAPGQSGNPKGRPLGSKNKISVLKLDLEHALRERMVKRLPKIIDAILTAAEEGDKEMRKLVWNSWISKTATAEEEQVKERISITIGKLAEDPPVKTIVNPNFQETKDNG